MARLRHTLLVPALLAGSAPALATDWQVDAEASSLTFAVSQQGNRLEGRFTEFEADIQLDPENLEEALIEVRIPLNKATLGTNQQDQILHGPVWFDAASYPTAIFKADTIRKAGAPDVAGESLSYVADGTLDLKGQSQPISLPFTLTISDAKAHATGTIDLTRTRWAVGTGQWASGDSVGLQVTVEVDITAYSDAP